MDPYLEHPAYWNDFHSTFINYWRAALLDRLPEHYDASIGEQVYLVDEAERKWIGPDIRVQRQELLDTPAAPAAGGGIATLEPVTIPLVILDEPRQPYVEIVHRPDQTHVRWFDAIGRVMMAKALSNLRTHAIEEVDYEHRHSGSGAAVQAQRFE